jgi:hypothetical protein
MMRDPYEGLTEKQRKLAQSRFIDDGSGVQSAQEDEDEDEEIED